MRYPALEKIEIIRLVERSHLPVRRPLDKLGIPATTFYRWYDRYRAVGETGLEDRTSGPGRVTGDKLRLLGAGEFADQRDAVPSEALPQSRAHSPQQPDL